MFLFYFVEKRAFLPCKFIVTVVLFPRSKTTTEVGAAIILKTRKFPKQD